MSSKLSQSMVFIIFGAMMSGMPQFLSISELIGGSAGVSDQFNTLTQSFVPLINAIFYIIGMFFVFKGALKFNEFVNESDTTTSINNFKSDKTIQISKEEQQKDIKVEKFEFDLDFENKQLNSKLNNIENIINSIISLPALENDYENKSLISSTQEKYIKQIHNAYIAIPKELREKKFKNYTAKDMAMEQLILIENGLLEVENELLGQQIKDLSIMDRFIKEKFSENKSFLTMTV